MYPPMPVIQDPDQFFREIDQITAGQDSEVREGIMGIWDRIYEGFWNGFRWTGKAAWVTSAYGLFFLIPLLFAIDQDMAARQMQQQQLQMQQQQG